MTPSASEALSRDAERVLPSATAPVMEREPVASSSTLTTAVVAAVNSVVPPPPSLLVRMRRMNLPTRDWSAGMEKVLAVPLLRFVQPVFQVLRFQALSF